MVEPTTVNKALIVPTTGDLSGTWGSAALNPDFTAIDGMFGGVVTVSLTNANVALTAPSGSVTAGAGPFQQQNAIIKFSGTLTGNCTITFTLHGATCDDQEYCCSTLLSDLSVVEIAIGGYTSTSASAGISSSCYADQLYVLHMMTLDW